MGGAGLLKLVKYKSLLNALQASATESTSKQTLYKIPIFIFDATIFELKVYLYIFEIFKYQVLIESRNG